MNVTQILNSVKSEVSNFLEAKKEEKRNPQRRMRPGSGADKFVKSNANDLMDFKTKTRYVNGICYGNGG